MPFAGPHVGDKVYIQRTCFLSPSSKTQEDHRVIPLPQAGDCLLQPVPPTIGPQQTLASPGILRGRLSPGCRQSAMWYREPHLSSSMFLPLRALFSMALQAKAHCKLTEEPAEVWCRQAKPCTASVQRACLNLCRDLTWKQVKQEVNLYDVKSSDFGTKSAYSEKWMDSPLIRMLMVCPKNSDRKFILLE